jgi:hypothetical protein
MITTRQTPADTVRALFEAIDSGDLVTIGALTQPCCNEFRVHNGLVTEYRIYMDINPVMAA